MHPLNLVLLVVALAGAWPALADSDGYFCVGPDYLAVEFSFSQERLEHRLYVWRIADTTQWQDAASVELSDFTVHGMRCERRSVQLAAWDAIHTVTWRQPEIETLELQITPKPAGPPDPTLFPSLAASLVFGREQTVSLRFGESHSYELRVRRARDESNPCRAW